MNTPRKLRTDLTNDELERLEKYGSIEFKSAGATRSWRVAPEVLKAEAERIQGLINR